jgi:P27 family predicted phage terminase small subunit
MAKRGPKPQPAAIKLLAGVRADRIPDAPPAVEGRPRMPDHLDQVAAEKWDEVVGALEQLGTLSRTDGDAIALYCSVFSRWIQAKEECKTGLVVHTDLGGVKQNPAVTIAAAAERQLQTLQSELGLSPSSRGRLKLGQGEAPKDDLADFLSTTNARKAR